MDYSVYKISLDIHKPEAQEVLEMKLLDSKRRIQISLTENGKVYQITPDCKAMFSAEKSDGNKIYNQCEIVDNTIIYDVTQQTLACLGEVDCEIQLLGSDEAVITSPRFSIIVHERVYNGEDVVDSEMETDVLPDLIAKSHEHENKEVLDGITQELLDQIGTSGGLTPEQAAQIVVNTRQLAENTYQIGEHTLQIQYLYELYNRVDPSAYATREEFNMLAQNLSDALLQYNEGISYELTAINTRIDGIEGGIDEIEDMIDESGVLDE